MADIPQVLTDDGSANWSDALAKSLAVALKLTVADDGSANWSDALAKSLAVDLPLTLTDDNSANWSDDIQASFVEYYLDTSDYNTLNWADEVWTQNLPGRWQDAIATFLIPNVLLTLTDSNTANWADVLASFLVGDLPLTLSDDGSANWLDDIQSGFIEYYLDVWDYNTLNWADEIWTQNLPGRWQDAFASPFNVLQDLPLALADDNSSNWSDGVALNFEHQLTLTDDNSANWNDAFDSPPNFQFSKWRDSTKVQNVGILLLTLADDNSANWLDAFVSLIPLTLADSNAANWADFVEPETYTRDLSDDLNNWSDDFSVSVGSGLSNALDLSDNLAFWDDSSVNVILEYRLQVGDDNSANWNDFAEYFYTYLLAAGDDNSANWNDAFDQPGFGPFSSWRDKIKIDIAIAETLSDSFTLTDAAVVVLDLLTSVSDSNMANWSDATALLADILLVLSDDEGPNWNEAFVTPFTPAAVDVQLVVDDDNSANWNEEFLSGFVELQLVVTDGGVQLVDSVVASFTYLLVVADDNSPNWSDAFDQISGAFSGWRDSIKIVVAADTGGQSVTVADNASPNWADQVSSILEYRLNVADDNSANWQEAFAFTGPPDITRAFADDLNNWQDRIDLPSQDVSVSLADDANQWQESVNAVLTLPPQRTPGPGRQYAAIWGPLARRVGHR